MAKTLPALAVTGVTGPACILEGPMLGVPAVTRYDLPVAHV